MKLKILGEKILVRVKRKTTTEGGIILPDTVVETPTTGEIAAIGNYIPESTGCQGLKEGDVIKWYGYVNESGMTITVDGEEFLMVRPNDVIGVFEPEKLIKV